MREMVGGCCVCSDERGWSENPLVYCDGHGCNVAVHQACYGIITVPSGPWFCKKCESQERAARVRCELCPQKDGALKRTDMGGWCHVVCALFIPEAWFGNVQTMEPIILKGVPPERFNKSCFICEEQGRASKATSGSCMQCNKNGCKQHFHVTCAQSCGLLCEEAGNYDNVKYCGYCQYHFKKLQKKDSHIKTIPAFKPIPADNATPEGTPEKHPPWVSKKSPAHRDNSTGGNFIHAKSLKEKKLAATSSDLYNRNNAAASVASSKDRSKDEAANSSSSSSSSTSKMGKFTTANFKETTITPSPASLFDFPGDEGKGSDKEMPEKKESLGSSSGEKKKKRLLDKPLLSNSAAANSKELVVDSDKIYDWEDEDDGEEDVIKKEREDIPPQLSLLTRDKLANETGKDSPRFSSSSLASIAMSSTSSVSSSLKDSSASNCSTMTAATTIAASASEEKNSKEYGGGYSGGAGGRGGGGGGYDGLDLSSGKGYGGGSTSQATSGSDIAASPTNSEPSLPVSRKRHKSGDKGVDPSATGSSTPEKKRVKKQRNSAASGSASATSASEKLGTSAATASGGANKAKTVKEILAANSPPPSPPPPSLLAAAARKPTGAGRGANKEVAAKKEPIVRGVSSSSFGAAQYRDNTTPISLSSLHKASHESSSDGPIIMNGTAGDDVVGAHPPPSRTVGGGGGGGGGGITSLAGLMSPRSAAAAAAASSGANNAADSAANMAPMPTSMEQLLERQWSQSSAFLMEQGQHFDIASLLNCLHQLRQENQRLEEHISTLTSRRDQLLAVNSRLSLPFTPLQQPNQQSNQQSSSGRDNKETPPSASPDNPHTRSPRGSGGGGGGGSSGGGGGMGDGASSRPPHDPAAMTPPPPGVIGGGSSSSSSSASASQFARPAPHKRSSPGHSMMAGASPASMHNHTPNHSPSKGPQQQQQHGPQHGPPPPPSHHHQQQQQREQQQQQSSSGHHPPPPPSWPAGDKPPQRPGSGGGPGLPPPPHLPPHSMAAAVAAEQRHHHQLILQQQQQHQQHAAAAAAAAAAEQQQLMYQMLHHHQAAVAGLSASGAPGGPPATSMAAVAAAAMRGKHDKHGGGGGGGSKDKQ